VTSLRHFFSVAVVCNSPPPPLEGCHKPCQDVERGRREWHEQSCTLMLDEFKIPQSIQGSQRVPVKRGINKHCLLTTEPSRLQELPRPHGQQGRQDILGLPIHGGRLRTRGHRGRPERLFAVTLLSCPVCIREPCSAYHHLLALLLVNSVCPSRYVWKHRKVDS